MENFQPEEANTGRSKTPNSSRDEQEAAPLEDAKRGGSDLDKSDGWL